MARRNGSASTSPQQTMCTFLHAGASFCFAGMRLTVVRAASDSEETITVGSLNDVHRTDGPIVAFYGLFQNDESCISRLGGYKLLGSLELASEL